MYATKYRNQWITIHKNCWNTTGNAKSVMENVWFAANQTVLHHKRKVLPNQAFRPTGNPLHSLPAAELGRQAAHHRVDKDRALVVGWVTLVALAGAVMHRRPCRPTAGAIRLEPHGDSAYVGHGSTNSAVSPKMGGTL